jgi:hypothetical protein
MHTFKYVFIIKKCYENLSSSFIVVADRHDSHGEACGHILQLLITDMPARAEILRVYVCVKQSCNATI